MIGRQSLVIDDQYSDRASFNFNGSGVYIDLNNQSGQINSLKSISIRELLAYGNRNAGVQIRLSNMTLDRLEVDRSVFQENGGAGLYLSLTNVKIRELIIHDSGNAARGETNAIFNSGDSHFFGNASDGIHIAGRANSDIDLLRMAGNVIEGNAGHGTLFDLEAVNVDVLSIVDNEVRENVGGSGLRFETNRTNIRGGRVAHNSLLLNGSLANNVVGHGISIVAKSLQGAVPTAQSNGLSLREIYDNDIRNNNGSGISIDLQEQTTLAATLLRNTISNNRGRGLDVRAADTDKAIDLTVGAATTNTAGLLVDGNVFQANLGAAIALELNDTSGNTGNTSGRFRIVGNTISGTLDDPASSIFNGEGIYVRALGDVTRQNGAARFFSSLIDRNTVEANQGDGIRFNISEDSELTDLTVGNLTGPQLVFDVNGASPGGSHIVPRQGDGNLIRNNGGNGISILRLASAIVENIRILDNRITGNAEGIYLQASNTYQTVPNAARPNLRVVSEFDLRNNDVFGNDLNGVHLRAEFNAVLEANLYYNRIDGNGLNGIRVTGLENNSTDFENVGGIWIKNAVTNNGTNMVRTALGLAALPLDSEDGNGVRIETVVGSVNPLVIGRDGLDADSQSFGNYIARNGSDGVEIASRAGGVGGGSTTVPVDVRDGLEIVNNQIIENGRNGVGSPYLAGKGIDIEVGPGQPREFRIDRNIIQGNAGDGIEILNSGGKLRLSAKGNFIDINGGRGVDLLNRALAPQGFDAEATVVFGDGNQGGVVNRNIVTRNGLEGVYVVNTVSPTQQQNVSSELVLDTVTISGSRIEANTLANLVLDIENNEIRDNGSGVANQGSPPSFLSGTGLVIRVGSQGSSGSIGAVPDISGYAPIFFPESLAGVGTNGSDGGNSVAGGYVLTANGRVNARVVNNEFSGNGGDDVLLEAFVSLVPRTTTGTWSETEFRDINVYDRDPLSRLNLVFTGNIGDSVDVVRGTGANDQQTYSFTNAEGDFKSRTAKTGNNPSGPFGNLPGRDRVITRVADRPVAAGTDGTLGSAYPDSYSGFYSGAPTNGPNRPQAGFGATSGSLGVIDGTDPDGPVLVTVASRTGVISAATADNPALITSANHGLQNGDTITIIGAQGNTLINGTWVVSNVTANTFTIPVDGDGTYVVGSGTWILEGQHRLSTGDIVSLFGTGRNDVNGTHVIEVIDESTFAIYVPNVILPETAVRGWGGTITGGTFIEHNSSKFHYDGIGPSTFRVEANQSVGGFRGNQLGDNFLTSTSVGTSPTTVAWDQVAAGTFSYLTASINDVAVNEAAGTATLTVTLSEIQDEDIFIAYRLSDGSAKLDPNNDGSTADGDFFDVGFGFVTVFAGSTTAQITVGIRNDTAFEDIEQFYVDLFQISGGDLIDSRGVITITPDSDPPVTVTVENVTVDEVSGQAVFTVKLSGASSEQVTVEYATAGGTATSGVDFVAGSGTVVFDPGQTEVTVSIPITSDRLDEADETFQLRISNPTNAIITPNAQGQAVAAGTATIIDTRTISVSDVQIDEDNGTATITVRLNKPLATGATASVDYATAGGTATSGSDFVGTSGTLTFTGTETVKTFTVTINTDAIKETSETFLVNLSGVVLNGVTLADPSAMLERDFATVTITDRWEAETDFGHAVGQASGDGWLANTVLHRKGYMLVGPATNAIPAGWHTASFRLLVNNNTLNNAPIVWVEVYDAASRQVLARKLIRRTEFDRRNVYQDFELTFQSTASSRLDFRVYWFDTATVKVDSVGLTTASTDRLVFEAEQDLLHTVGRAEGDGWAGIVSRDRNGYLSLGPRTSQVPAGSQSASFRLQIDSIRGTDSSAVRIDVYDAVTRRVLAARVLRRSDFVLPNAYQDFDLAFSNTTGSRLEFRTFWYDTMKVKLDRVTVSRDGATASPSVQTLAAGAPAASPSTGGQTADGRTADPDRYRSATGILAQGPLTTVGTGANSASTATIQAIDARALVQPLAAPTISRGEVDSTSEYEKFALALANSAGAAIGHASIAEGLDPVFAQGIEELLLMS